MRSSAGRLAPMRSSRSGFTMIELAVVLIVLSIMSSIALANFIKFQKRASFASCVSNQRHVLEASTLYISLENPGNVAYDVNVLVGNGYLSQEIGECPRSAVHAMNDYHITVVNNRVTGLNCKILPVDHQWNLP